MKKITIIILVILAMLNIAEAQTSSRGSSQAKLEAGVSLGYYSGMGFQVFGMISDFAKDFPLSARIGIGYTSVNPGKSAEARRIFINDATNGTPEKSGRTWDYRLDLLYKVNILSLKRAYALIGPRHAKFTGNFKYIGGNEDFDITGSQWGLGAGLESYFAMSNKIDLVITGGLDYYFNSRLTGHDTSYSPDGDNVNPRNDYVYKDADEAIGQPKLEPRLMFGFTYKF